jgi:membrane protein implicated in regulation of membrane protease activity
LAYARVVDIRKTLIVLGIVLIATGLLWPWLRQLGLGRLPGDIAINRPGVQIYFPIVTCLVISVVVTLLFWLFRK